MLYKVGIVLSAILAASADKQINDGAGNDYTSGRLGNNYGTPSGAPSGYTIQNNDGKFDVDCLSSGGQAGCTGERILFEGAALSTGKDTATYDTNFAACKAACETWNTCTGFTYVYNPGMYDSVAKVNRCVGKAGYPHNGGELVTSRFGMAFYSRDAGAVTGQTDGTTTDQDIANAVGGAMAAAAGMATGLLVAVIVIPIVAIILLIVCIVCCCKSCNKNKNAPVTA